MSRQNPKVRQKALAKQNCQPIKIKTHGHDFSEKNTKNYDISAEMCTSK